MIKKTFYYLLNIFIALKYVLNQTYPFDNLDSDYTSSTNTKYNHIYVNYGDKSYSHTVYFFQATPASNSPIMDKINGLIF